MKFGLLLVESFETKLSKFFIFRKKKNVGKFYYLFIMDRLYKINILK